MVGANVHRRAPRGSGERANVLLLVLDTQNASRMSLYGHDRPTTPNIDELAADGVVFDRAFSSTSGRSPVTRRC